MRDVPLTEIFAYESSPFKVGAVGDGAWEDIKGERLARTLQGQVLAIVAEVTFAFAETSRLQWKAGSKEPYNSKKSK